MSLHQVIRVCYDLRVAGVAREAKAAMERLPDRISIGVLASVFTRP
jgi:hypothetical protein